MKYSIIKKIIELPRHLADKIAAGEVVDRPVSIVKELIENSIDAGADSIAVEIHNGGKSYIRITDNGSGIPADEVELAFKRHATSKISTAEDLDDIWTLGFRGEALASIAAVSKVQLITKTKDARAGTSITIEGGVVTEVTQIGSEDGTTIVVKDLFYNTPARKKFLKQDSTESSLIIDLISKITLAYPNIKIRLDNNGKLLFSTNGKGNTLENISEVYSAEMAKKLLPILGEMEGLQVKGYISQPSLTKTNRKNQIFFVNGRSISGKILEKAVTEGYREKMFEGRFPVVFLFLTMDPRKLDVNIHPNKKEIRFEDEKLVMDFISHVIRDGLNQHDAVTEIRSNDLSSFQGLKEKPAATNGGVIGSGENNKTVDIIQKDNENVDIIKLLKTKRIQRDQMDGQENGNVPGKSTHNQGVQEIINFTYPISPEIGRKYKSEEMNGNLYGWTPVPAVERKFNVMAIKSIGSVFGRYILGWSEDNFYIIDQHAAHERVFYEQLMEQYFNEEKLSQQILLPITVDVPYAVKSNGDPWLVFLRSIGYEIEEFGAKSYAVKAVPMYMSFEEAEDFIHDFLDNISDTADFRNQKRIEKIISNSCKKAVKGNDNLDISEINELIRQLATTKNPFTCPHGRPTIVKITQSEMDKMFKRV